MLRTLSWIVPLVTIGFLADGMRLNVAEAQGFGRNKIQYEDFEWQVLETDHFDVYHYPEAEELAQIGAGMAEEIYEELENRFAFSLAERVPLVFYATNLHFKQTNITPGFIPDGVGGFFEFLKGRVVIPANGNLHRFRRVIRHELVHVFTFNKMARVLRDHRKPARRALPLWFTEGLAEYWSGEPDHQHEMIMRDAVASNYFVPLDDMQRILGSFVMYKEGESFCRFVSETYGEEKLLDFIEQSWRSTDFGDVLEFVLKQDEEIIGERWREWLRSEYHPTLVEADVPSLVTEPIVGRGIAAKPVVYESDSGRRYVIYVGNNGSYTSLYSVEVDARLEPIARPRRIVRSGTTEDFESFHVLESRMDVTDSGTLAFVTKRGERDVVHLYDLEGDRRLAMYGFDELNAIYSPTLSSDGEQIAFTGLNAAGQSDLYLFERTPQRLRQLTNDAYDDRDPDFRPDNRRLAFSSDRSESGQQGSYHIFEYDLETHAITQITAGKGEINQSPRYNGDGNLLAFSSARRGGDGRFSSQDLWVSRREKPAVGLEPLIAAHSSSSNGHSGTRADSTNRNHLTRLTRFTSAAFDPVWGTDSTLVFGVYENLRFSIRKMGVDSLLNTNPIVPRESPYPQERWAFEAIDGEKTTGVKPYKRKYQVDVAAASFTTVPSAGYSAGGAGIVLSDMLGDEYIVATAYSANPVGRSFLDGLNAGVTRIHLGRRANYGYGAFRLSGPRYDRSDPDQPLGIPAFEQEHGVFGVVSYPLSQFRRIDLQTTVSHSYKEGLFREFDNGPRVFDTLRTAQLSNAIALVHDNALYGMFGPVNGWRGNLTLAYTTDVLHSEVSYYTVSADVRHYLDLGGGVTFASWGLVRANVGRRARLNLIGGSWSLRGYPFLRVRGQKLWFTSQELRFPVLHAGPGRGVPVLGAIGIAGVRGAVFADVAHLWNDSYSEKTIDTGTDFPLGQTIASIGTGLRVNLLGALVLRYDLGLRFVDGVSWSAREPFQQFFFGWDF